MASSGRGGARRRRGVGGVAWSATRRAAWRPCRPGRGADMAQIIQHRQIVEVVHYKRNFTLREDRSCGLSFDCDQDGNVDLARMERERPAAAENYRRATTPGQQEYDDDG